MSGQIVDSDEQGTLDKEDQVRHTRLWWELSIAVVRSVVLSKGTFAKTPLPVHMSARLAATSSPVQITNTGRIGSLSVGVSTHSEIVAFAGQPGADVQGAERSEHPYEALGYNCIPRMSNHPDLSRIELTSSPPTEEDISSVPTQACLTVFYIDESKGALVVFATTSSSYRENDGLRVGLATQTVDRRAQTRAIGGCLDAFSFRTRHASLTALIDGGKDVPHRHNGNTELIVKGGHISEIVITAATDELGLFDCVDS